jgi:hypothetical protein
LDKEKNNLFAVSNSKRSFKMRKTLANIAIISVLLMSAAGCDEIRTTLNPLEMISTEQDAFLDVVVGERNAYLSGTSINKDKARENRGSKLRSLLEPKGFIFTEWEATVVDVESTYSVGLRMPHKVVILTVQIGPDLYLTNHSYSFGINIPSEAILEDSQLFPKISSLYKGQKVRISGMFLISDELEPLEVSFTTESSMNVPYFRVEYSEII